MYFANTTVGLSGTLKDCSGTSSGCLNWYEQFDLDRMTLHLVWMRGTEADLEGGRLSLMDNAVTASPSIKENGAVLNHMETMLEPCVHGVKGSWGLEPTKGMVC